MDVYSQSRFVSRNKPYSRKSSPTKHDPYRDNSTRRASSKSCNSERECMSIFPVNSTTNTAKNRNEWINKTPDNNRLTLIKERKEKTWQQENRNDKETMLLSRDEFPALGENSFNRYYTPEGDKDWKSSNADEQQKKRRCGQFEQPRYKRRLLLAESQQDNIPGKPEKKFTARPVMKDEHKLKQRQKQIDFGKNTIAYGRYSEAVPRSERKKEDPWTPDKYQSCSTRSWVGQIKLWRRSLHLYDPPKEQCQELFPNCDAPFEHKDWGTLVEEEEEKQLSFQHLSQSTNTSSKEYEGKMEVDYFETSSTQSSAMDDIFQEFDLDSCLLNDGLPL